MQFMFYFCRVLLRPRSLIGARTLSVLVLAVLVFSNIFFLTPSTLLAEQSFQWLDKAGNKVYGSKPPADAKDIKEFKTRALSTYSSEKAISRMEPEVSSETSEESANNRSDGELRPGPVQKIIINNETSPSFSVEIANPGTETARNIKVIFRFSNGNTATATGPDILAPKGVATFLVPSLLVPAENLETGKAIDDGLPEVEISYDLTL